MGLQFYYVFISIYGWYNWAFGGKKEINKILHITVTSAKLWVKLFIANAILFVIISYILINHTDSTIPYWDAFTTAASIVATWMLAQKKIEHWLIWIVVDIVSLGLYIYKDLFATVILFAVYTILALIGYLEWRKDLKKILKES
jgi:nicotinamide mononucleotide transporter